MPFRPGQWWGAPWSTSWFRALGEVPGDWAGRRVEAVFDLGFDGGRPGDQAEALVYDEGGTPVKGIAPRNQYVPVAGPAAGGERVSLLIEAAANPAILAGGFRPTPLGDPLTAPATSRCTGSLARTWRCSMRRSGSSCWTSRCSAS